MAVDVAGVSLPLMAESTRRALAPHPGVRALVPGCGRAYDAIFLADQCGFESVVAVDLSPTACDAAREEVATSGASPSVQARVAVECVDFFEMPRPAEPYDLIWDNTFLCALEPAVRAQWAEQMHRLLADDGELLTNVFPIGAREGGPPFAMSVDLVRSLLEPAGFEATLVRDDLPLEQQHRRPGDPLESVRTRGSALVSWRKKQQQQQRQSGVEEEEEEEEEEAAKRRRRTPRSPTASMSLSKDPPGPLGPLLIDTDCGLDDLATLALAASASAPLRLVTTTSGLAPPGHGHLLARRMLDRVGLTAVPVVAGAEAPPATTVRSRQEWETTYDERVAAVTRDMGMETSFATRDARVGPCDAAAAADAMVEAARSAGGGATILALGALTNLAEAVRRHPADFPRLVKRIVFIADTDPSRQSYNAALDPAALRTVLGSGTELVLVGSACYPRPDWVERLFREEIASGEGGEPSEGGQAEAAAATALRVLGRLDPYSMCYDPLALLFFLEPGAFTLGQATTPVRVSGDTGTEDGWRFESCEAEAEEQGGGECTAGYGRVIEPSAVSLERYAAFLQQACSGRGQGGFCGDEQMPVAKLSS